MFSGTVKLGDLNDYIAPAQACVVALQGGKLAPGQDDSAAAAAPANEDGGGVVLQRKRRTPRAAAAAAAGPPAAPVIAPRPPPGGGGFQQTYTEGGADAAQGAVRVTLHDCLACAGCVTSAETVLLQQQSSAELLRRLSPAERPFFDVVVSVSPQSRASLAALHGLGSAADAHLRLATFFKEVLGARAVLDLGVAREVALLEAGEEFCARFAASGALSRAAGRLRAAGAARAAAAADAAAAAYAAAASPGPPPAPLPVLASACPGWVCYAEKATAKGAAPRALRHLSGVRSPQGVMGALVKKGWGGGGGGGWRGGAAAAGGGGAAGAGAGAGAGGGSGAAETRGSGPGEAGTAKKVYHVTVMPCYDKKLEAARDELVVVAGATAGEAGSGGGGGGGGSNGSSGGDGRGGDRHAHDPEPEVDCCLATSEVQALLEAHGCADLSSVAPATELDTLDGRAVPAAAVVAALAAAGADAGAGGGAGPLVDQPPLHDPAWGRPGSLPGSGGWAAFVMRYAARRLFGLELSPPGSGGGGGASGGGGPLAPRRLRNADMHELALEVRQALEAEGAPVGDHLTGQPPLLRFAAAYGFRNIQAVVRRLPAAAAVGEAAAAAAAPAGEGGGDGGEGDAAGALMPPSLAAAAAAAPSCLYDYVEVFACPGGCLNGGGQMAAAKAVAAAGAAAGGAAAANGGGGGGKSAAAALDELENYFAGADGAAAGEQETFVRWRPGQSAAVRRVYEGLASPPPADGPSGSGQQRDGRAPAPVAAAAAAAPGGVGSAAARAAFHTTFRRRETTLASAVGDW